MTKKEVVAVYIDGSNTYNRLKGLGMPDKSMRFDLSTFVKHLAGERALVSIGMIKESSVSRVFSRTDLVQFQSKTKFNLENTSE